MNDDCKTPLPDEFVSLLVDYDEALASGSDKQLDDLSRQDLEPQLEGRLARVQGCLRLIERFRHSGVDSSSCFATSVSTGSSLTVPGPECGPLVESDGADLLPTTLGRFQIIREIGRGGCGVVFLAIDPDLEREVALKLPHPEVVLTADLRARFLREGKAVAALNHANVLPVYEAGTAGPICYLAAAYCSGPSLKQWLETRRAPVPPGVAVRLIIAIADAVQHAHNRGVVHRDLKPGNVLLKVDDQRIESPDTDDELALIPLVTDFGLAKVAREQSDQTRTGDIIGTPSYMAPEQAKGQIEEVGPAADIYALGSMLYELLVGQPPFRGETDLATLRAVEQDEPLPPRRVRAEVPRDLEAICLKCLEKSPSKRYASASELADDLQRYVAGAPVRARRIGTAERFVRWCRRNPVVAGLSSAVLMLLVALSVGSTVAAVQFVRERDRTRVARDEAEKHFAEADRQRQRAEASLGTVRDAVDKMLTEVGFNQLVSKTRMEPVRRGLLEQALQFYQQILEQEGTSPEALYDIGMARLRLGMINRWLGNNERAMDYLQRASREFKTLAAEDPDHDRYRMPMAESYYHLAEINVTLNHFDDAASLYRDAVAIYRDLPGAAPAGSDRRLYLARTLNGLGFLLHKSGHVPDAEQFLREAISLQRELMDQSPENHEVQFALASTRHNLAFLLANTRRLDEAEKTYQESLRLYESLAAAHSLPDYRQALATVCDDRAAMLMRADRFEQAERDVRRALKIRDALAKEFPDVADYRARLAKSFGNLAWLLTRMGRSQKAEEAYRQCIAELSELIEDDPKTRVYLQSLSRARNNFAIMLLSRGSSRLADAEPVARAAAEMLRQLVEEFPDVPDFRSQLGASLHTQAALLKQQNRFEEARQVLREAITMQSAALASNEQHGTYRRFLSNHYYILTGVLAHQGKYRQAALSIQERTELYPDSWTEQFSAAGKLRAMQLQVTDDASRPAADRAALAEWLRTESLNVLAKTKENVPRQITDPSRLNSLALLLAATPDPEFRDLPLAIEYMQRALQQHPDHADAKYFWATLGVARVAAGNWQEGKDALDRSFELETRNTLAWFALAIAHHELGNNSRATSAFNKGMTQLEANSSPSEALLYLRDEARGRLEMPID